MKCKEEILNSSKNLVTSLRGDLQLNSRLLTTMEERSFKIQWALHRPQRRRGIRWPISRTNSIVMVDQTCLREAVHQLEGLFQVFLRNLHPSESTTELGFATFEKRLVSICFGNRHEVAKATEMFRELGNAYQPSLRNEKKLKKQRKRIEKLQQDQRLTDQASLKDKHEELNLIVPRFRRNSKHLNKH